MSNTQSEALRLAGMLKTARVFNYGRKGLVSRFIELNAEQVRKIEDELRRLDAENKALTAQESP